MLWGVRPKVLLSSGVEGLLEQHSNHISNHKQLKQKKTKPMSTTQNFKPEEDLGLENFERHHQQISPCCAAVTEDTEGAKGVFENILVGKSPNG